MREFLQIGILPVMLTLLSYQLGLSCQRKFRLALLNPLLIAVVLVIAALKVLGMDTNQYQQEMNWISWLLTPATVSLAVPMYEQVRALRKNLKAILAGVAAGMLSCLIILLVGMVLAGFPRELTVSLLPKGITTAIALPLVEMFEGTGSITMLGICVTGIFGNMLGSEICRLFRITDPVAMGVAFGTGSHVIGTTKAAELDPLTGAVGSLSLVVAGLLTAAVFPVLVSFL